MNGLTEGPQSTSQTTVFINYYIGDRSSAQRLYSDLKAANLNPWIDNENLLPGQDRSTEIEKAIRGSRFFVTLLSARSINERGDAQVQIKMGLNVRNEFPESQIYFIPTRLDEFDISQNDLIDIEYVDLFPSWEEGLKRILKAMNIAQKQIELVIQHQRINSPFTSSGVSLGTIQTLPFKGEKQFFVGRQKYINQIIKDKLRIPGSKVSIVGPGGSGKSQLAFKAVHQYIKEDIFDLVIPIYFDEGLIPFDKFLLQIAEIFGLKKDSFEINTTMEQHKDIIRDLLSNKKHPLIYLDNFETVSLILNEETSENSKELKLNARQITDFLNNTIPADNTSVLVTSRERVNNLSNEQLTDLEGLDTEDSMKLFNAFVRPIFKDPKGKIKDQIKEILKKTGGHPLSVEIIAKNLRGIHELENILQNLSGLKGDPTQAEERFQTLQTCFEYTINKLDENLQRFLPKLTLFKSPFPISAAVEIFNASENEILDLYDRSLLKLVDSDELYGKVQDPEYWLYNFHPAVRNYVEDMMREKNQSYHDLETQYGKEFSTYYYNLLQSVHDSIGKENHRSSFARFNIIYQPDVNDFDRAIELTTDKQQSANILSYLGLVVSQLGMLSKALEIHTRSIDIYEEIKDKHGMRVDYSNIGLVLMDMGRLDEALEYHKKALQIDEEIYERGGMAKDYKNIGIVLTIMGRLDEALEYHKKALQIDEEIYERGGMAKDYKNIGIVLTIMGRLDEALEYHKKSLGIDEKELNERVEMANDYKNIGIVPMHMGRLDEALEYHKKSLGIDEGLNDRVGMAGDYTNIGNVLKDLNKRQEAVESVEKGLNILLELKEKTGYHHPLIEKLKQIKESLDDLSK